MRARLPWLLVLAGAYALASDSVKPRPRPAPAPYAGAAKCGDCHGAEMRAWERSPHARHGIAVKQPEGGADAAVGARWMQAYLRKDEQGYHRIAPRCYDLREDRWRSVYDVLEAIRGSPFDDDATLPPLSERSFERDCSGCHASGTRLRLDPRSGHMDSGWRDLAIDCEACHGAGGAHAAAWSELRPTEPLARLETLPHRAATAVCVRCHGGPPAPGDYGPADAQHFVGLLEDRAGLFPDGTASGQVYQYSAFVRSPCYLEGGLSCTGCHEAHGPGLRHREHADALCTRCHEEQASRAHTHHDMRGAGSRCVECHMPRLLDGVMAHQRDHRIGNPLPATPYAPDACTACHEDETKEWADQAYRRWWGEPPQRTLDAIEAIYLARKSDPRAPPLLKGALRHPDPFFRAAAALYLDEGAELLDDPVPEVRLAAVRAAAGGPDPIMHLQRALEDPEPRVRSAAVLELVQLGEPVDASYRPDLELTLRQVRRLPLAQIIVGVSQLRRNEPAQALQTFEAVAALHPQAVEAWRGMATAYAALGRGDDERACLRRLGDLLAHGIRGPVPDLELVAAALSAFIRGGAPDRARTLFERLLRDVPRGRLRSRIELMNARFRNHFGGRGS